MRKDRRIKVLCRYRDESGEVVDHYWLTTARAAKEYQGQILASCPRDAD